MANKYFIRQVIPCSVFIFMLSVIARADDPHLLPTFSERDYEYHYNPQTVDWNIPQGWNWSTATLGSDDTVFTDNLDAPGTKWQWETEWYNPGPSDLQLSIKFIAEDFEDRNFPRNLAFTVPSGDYKIVQLPLDETPYETGGEFEYYMWVDRNPSGPAFRHDCSFCERRGPLIGAQNQDRPPSNWTPMPLQNNGPVARVDVIVLVKPRYLPSAWGPEPQDGTVHENTWVILSWKPGAFAVSHDLYLGGDYDTVSDATQNSDVFRGNQSATDFIAGFPGFPYPDGLVPGTTYFWRVDEVNDADTNSPWKGSVWSFSIPPHAAYFPDPPDGAEFIDPNNVILTWAPGFGARQHTVYFGDDYGIVDEAVEGVPHETTTYDPGRLEAEKVYYWRVDEFDGLFTYKGDVWTFTTLGAVGNPSPAYDTTNVQLNAIVSWTPADSAVSHELYFGTDKDAVRYADTSSPEYKGSMALGAESYNPGLLEPETTYYWRVDEVDAQDNKTRGPLWIFTTGDFLLIDDFEGYTDNDSRGEVIWQTWIDGFGIADNGAQVGNVMPPYAEQSIVHGGSQSMPLMYANEPGVTYSEATMMLTTMRDWTQSDVVKLSIWFRGRSDNASEPLYVAISNSHGATGVVVYDDAGAAQISRWTEWIIPLRTFADQGINLTNVDKIAIGLGTKAGIAGSRGSGTMYFDDIRLCRP